MVDYNDLVGTKVDRLKVIKYLGPYRKSNNNICHVYLCKCDCGNYVERSRSYLIAPWESVHTKSCGCAQIDHIMKLAKKTRGVPITHGKSKTRLYKLWHRMNNRCYIKTNNRYDRYGGRGIYVCDEWCREKTKSDGFMNFYNWAYENGYYDQPADTPRGELLTIERKDPNGPYAPWNCKWIPGKDQALNRENTWRIEICGTSYSVPHICKIAGISPHSLTCCWKGKNGYVVWKPAWIAQKIMHPELGLHLDHFGVLRDCNGFIRLINTQETKNELDKFLSRTTL